MAQVAFLASPALWRAGHGEAHPLKPERLQRTFELLQAYGAFDEKRVRLVEPRPATEHELALFHTPDYIHAVRALSRGEGGVDPWRYGFGPGDNPVFPRMYETESLKAGSALRAAEMLLAGECQIAFSYAGGMHHAGPARAWGFCVFNDAAVVIHWLLRQGLRVAYVDVDVHHGDGVQAAFYDSDRVLTISLHQSGRTLFPGTGFVEERGRGSGEGFSVNVPLPPFTWDEPYLWALQEVVPPLVKRFAPDMVVTQMGVDTHFRDPLANLALTTRGQEAAFRLLSSLGRPWLALGGGGYNLDVVPRAWTLAVGVMAERAFPDQLPQTYRRRYGGRWLHDREAPEISATVRELTSRRVREVVGQVKAAFAIGVHGEDG